jgi:hypothetical protein
VQRVKLLAVRRQIFEGIGLNEGVRIIRLRLDVNACHIEPGTAVAFASPAGFAEKIE